MTLTQPCPVCHTPQTMSDPSVGTRVRCANCQAEFEAGNPAPGGPPGRTPPPQRVRRLTLALVVLACVAAAGAYWAVTRPTPIDVADPDGIFSARFPNPVTTERSDGNPLALKGGERL